MVDPPPAKLPMSHYRHHVFFCCNQRESGASCCNDHGASEVRDYAKKQVKALGLSGEETFDILGIQGSVQPGQRLQVRATMADGTVREFHTKARIDTPVEVEYYRHGGILPYVLRNLAKA